MFAFAIIDVVFIIIVSVVFIIIVLLVCGVATVTDVASFSECCVVVTGMFMLANLASTSWTLPHDCCSLSPSASLCTHFAGPCGFFLFISTMPALIATYVPISPKSFNQLTSWFSYVLQTAHPLFTVLNNHLRRWSTSVVRVDKVRIITWYFLWWCQRELSWVVIFQVWCQGCMVSGYCIIILVWHHVLAFTRNWVLVSCIPLHVLQRKKQILKLIIVCHVLFCYVMSCSTSL
jgi:hypothetical protein